MEKILLFQVREPEKKAIQKLADNKKIRVIPVEKTDFDIPLGVLADGKKAENVRMAAGEGEDSSLPAASLMVFCGVSEKHLNKLLFEMRSKKIIVDYKAVLTDTNRSWTVGQLYPELERERKKFEEKG